MLREKRLLAWVAGVAGMAAVSCAPSQNVVRNPAQKKYYHDQVVGVGSNIPRSYNDDSLSTTSSQNSLPETNALEFQQMQRTVGNQAMSR